MTDAGVSVNVETASAKFATKSIQQAVNHFNSNLTHGLTTQEVDHRRKRYGQNLLEMKESEPLYMKFLDQLKQPLILLLLASAFVSLVVGQYDDAFSITLAIFIVVTVAFVQEHRSEKSLEALNHLVPHYCHVLRDGRLMTTLASELVPGDVVSMSMGDRVPADLRLSQVVDLEIDESSLSGETVPSHKFTQAMTGVNIPVVERKNIAFLGTLVRAGHGRGVVVATAKDTEFGSIWSMMQEVEDKKTPLQLRMEHLGEQLSILSFGIIAVISLVGLIQGRGWMDTFTIAVSLAVAAIPEGLPIVVTVTLALGVLRMANKHAIVKRLPSVESLGSVNVLCADKTGTLTMNKMTITQIHTPVDGSISLENAPERMQELAHRPTICRLFQAASLCNNASHRDGEYIGQPTEISILEALSNMGIKDERSTHKRSSEIPFDSEQKWMATQYEVGQSSFHFVKGAPEVILDRCHGYFAETSDSRHQYSSLASHIESFQTVKTFSADQKKAASEAAFRMSARGLRVLGVAYGSDLKELNFLGFLAMYDPPREGAANTIAQLNASGVRVVMITGDALGTAINIASQLGILSGVPTSPVLDEFNDVRVISGSDIEGLSARETEDVVSRASVFYRTTPRHKLQIVEALQHRGDVVAMTGDGVNDAPALKMADIGIAMGKTGTDVSKEAADMILVNDNIATILSAIEEGKSIFYNIRNFLRFQLSTSISALTLIATAIMFRLPTPLNAMQILWINIIMDGPPAQSLGVEPVDQDVMNKPPRRKDASILNRNLLKRILTSAVIMVVGTMIIFHSELQDGVVTARDTTMTFTTFVFFDMFNALCCRSEKKSIFKIGFLSNKAFAIAVGASVLCQLLVIYAPFFQAIFQTEALGILDLLKIILISSTVFWVDELRKWYVYGPGRTFARNFGFIDNKAYEMV